MSSITFEPIATPLNAVVSLPGSKSLTNRALILAALANGQSTLAGALFSEDTERMIDALSTLGFAVDADATHARIIVTGHGGHIPNPEGDIHCGNSGTTIRFCAALASLGHGNVRFDGIDRMRERPIGALVDALRQVGGLFEYENKDGFPPLTVHGQGLKGGWVRFNRPESSQFVSAVMMVAPIAFRDTLIEVVGGLVSEPYVTMTAATMREFGVETLVQRDGDDTKIVVAAPQNYQSGTYLIEPDASNASYFLAAPAIAGGRVAVSGIGTDSVQGDARFVDVLEQMGCKIDRATDQLTVSRDPGSPLTGIDVDLNEMPDMVQTLAVVALFADGPTHIRNVANLRVKETDRLAALATELRKLAATIDEREDGLSITPPDKIANASIATYDDHRMAMSFALATLAANGIVIEEPECVAKTFPNFFDLWAQLLRGKSSIS